MTYNVLIFSFKHKHFHSNIILYPEVQYDNKSEDQFNKQIILVFTFNRSSFRIINVS